MAKPSLDDYVDVAERIEKFIAAYPEGSLQTIDWSVETVGESMFIVYRAAAYRTPGDKRPGHGTAWEPFPGPTPYTRNSELMNAETSAWGRAIIALGIGSKKIASKQEVQARQAEQEQREQAPTNGQPELASEKDVAEIREAATGLERDQIKLAMAACGLSGSTRADQVPRNKVVAVIKALGLSERHDWAEEDQS